MKMGKREVLALWAIVGLFAVGIIGPAIADTGADLATRIERGTYLAVRKVTADTVKGTALFESSNLRPDGMCRNVSGYTVYVGTVSANEGGASTHSNEVNGFPVLHNETFRLNGGYRGALYATCNSATASCELRCLDGLVYP